MISLEPGLRNVDLSRDQLGGVDPGNRCAAFCFWRGNLDDRNGVPQDPGTKKRNLGNPALAGVPVRRLVLSLELGVATKAV
jgi:hypothetical protein